MLRLLNKALFTITNILTSPIGYLLSILVFDYLKLFIFILNTNVILILSIVNLFTFSIKRLIISCGGLYLQYLCYNYYKMLPITFFFINYVIITMLLSHFQSVWMELSREDVVMNYKARHSFKNLHNYLTTMALFPFMLVLIGWIFKY